MRAFRAGWLTTASTTSPTPHTGRIKGGQTKEGTAELTSWSGEGAGCWVDEEGICAGKAAARDEGVQLAGSDEVTVTMVSAAHSSRRIRA